MKERRCEACKGTGKIPFQRVMVRIHLDDVPEDVPAKALPDLEAFPNTPIEYEHCEFCNGVGRVVSEPAKVREAT